MEKSSAALLNLLVFLCVFPPVCSFASSSTEPMAWTCSEKPFVSASVSTPRRDGESSTQIKLVDPHGREQGARVHTARIPGSQYHDIVEVQRLPNNSLEHAIEVCDAETGEYQLTIYEHSDKPYRITVRAHEGNKVSYSMDLQLVSRNGKTRHYRFAFTTTNDTANVVWLDDEGHEQMQIANREW